MRMRVVAAVVALALVGCSTDAGGQADQSTQPSTPIPTTPATTKLELPDRTNARAASASLPSTLSDEGVPTVAVTGGQEVQPGRYQLKIPDVAAGVRAECSIDIVRPDNKGLAPYDYRQSHVKAPQIRAAGGILYAADITDSDEITVSCYGLQSFTLEFEPLATKKLAVLPHAGDWVAGLDFEPGRYQLQTSHDRLFTSIYSTDGALTSRGMIAPSRHSVVAELSRGDVLGYSSALDRSGTAHGGQLQLEATEASVERQAWSRPSPEGGVQTRVSVFSVYQVGRDIAPGFYRVDVVTAKPVDVVDIGLVSSDGDELACVEGDVETGAVAPTNVAVIHLVEGQLVEFRINFSSEDRHARRKGKGAGVVELVPVEVPRVDVGGLKSGIYVVGEDVPAGLYEIGAFDASGQRLSVVDESGLLLHYDPDMKRGRAKTQNIEFEDGQALMVSSAEGFELRPRK